MALSGGRLLQAKLNTPCPDRSPERCEPRFRQRRSGKRGIRWLWEKEMADTTRSDSDAARIKRGTLSVKTKRKQPFVLESFLYQADGGRTKAKYRKNEIIFRQGD